MKKTLVLSLILGFLLLQGACCCGTLAPNTSLSTMTAAVDYDSHEDEHDHSAVDSHSSDCDHGTPCESKHGHSHHKCFGEHIFAASAPRLGVTCDESIVFATANEPIAFVALAPILLSRCANLTKQAQTPTLPLRAELQVFLI